LSGDSTLETGEGIVPDFKEKDAQEKQTLKVKVKKRGLKNLSMKPETDQDRKKQANKEEYKKGKKEGKQTDGKKPNK
jgi:ubiquitin